MKSKSKEGTLLIIIGLLLIAASLFLIGYNLYDEYRAGESAERVLTVLQENTPDSSTVEKFRASSFGTGSDGTTRLYPQSGYGDADSGD